MRAVVVGAGLGGLSAACHLAGRGHDVVVLEREPEPGGRATAVRQHGHTRDMAFGIPFLVAYISGVMTLEPGDLVLTGTPEGVGPLGAGDVVEVEVPGVGILRNPVGTGG